MKNILIVDNYDSFVYNIPHVISSRLKINYEVVRNNKITKKNFSLSRYSHIIISPGPGNPDNFQDFGFCQELINFYSGNVPILGICLGHQGIAAHFGAKIERAKKIMHGYTCKIKITANCVLFKNVESYTVMRYHSLVVNPTTLPSFFNVTSVSDDNYKEIMSFSDADRGIYAVQFHPESIGTVSGSSILNNFINI